MPWRWSLAESSPARGGSDEGRAGNAKSSRAEGRVEGDRYDIRQPFIPLTLSVNCARTSRRDLLCRRRR